MSDIDTTGQGVGQDLGQTEGEGRKGRAKAAIGQASETLKQEAKTFTDAAQARARDAAQKRTEAATKAIGDFANAVRKAGDELAQGDQGPAARVIGRAADGLETLSRNLEGRRPEELLDAVRDFGRRHPAAFIGGAVLAGVALGRFARASQDAANDDGPDATAELSGLAGGEPYPAANMAGADAVVETPGLLPADVEESASVLGVDNEDDDAERRGI